MKNHHIRTDYAALPEDWQREPEPPRRRWAPILVAVALVAVLAGCVAVWVL